MHETGRSCRLELRTKEREERKGEHKVEKREEGGGEQL